MVEICNGYYFEHDKRCASSLTLIRKETRKKYDLKARKELDEVVEATRTIGYYSSIEAVIKAAATDMVARKCDNDDITTIRKYLDEYNFAVKMLTDAINGTVE